MSNAIVFLIVFNVLGFLLLNCFNLYGLYLGENDIQEYKDNNVAEEWIDRKRTETASMFIVFFVFSLIPFVNWMILIVMIGIFFYDMVILFIKKLLK